MNRVPTPPRPRDLPQARLQLRKEALMNEIRNERSQPTYRRRRRRLAALLLPAALLGIAATGYALLKADEVVAAGIGCYDAPTTDANTTVVETTGDSPTKICGDLWAQGVVRQGATEVPDLIACANESGAILVFPSDDEELCAHLALQDLPEDYEAAAKEFANMRDDLVARLYDRATAGGISDREACLDEDNAVDIARSVLDDHGFSDWTVEVATGDYAGRECANSLGFEDAARRVLIIPSDPGIDPDPFGPH
jgi:hypothetical protein